MLKYPYFEGHDHILKATKGGYPRGVSVNSDSIQLFYPVFRVMLSVVFRSYHTNLITIHLYIHTCIIIGAENKMWEDKT